MSQTAAQQFQRNFGEYQHQARRELVLMSAERYDLLLAEEAAEETSRQAPPAIAC